MTLPVIIAQSLRPVALEVTCDGSQTVADIVRLAGFLPREMAGLEVTINDHPIPAAHWHRVRPKPRPAAVMMIAMRPGGGAEGGGAARTVLTLLLVAGAIAISGGALAFGIGAANIGFGAGATLFAAGSFEASLAAAAVLGLGQMGLEALFPSSVAPTTSSASAADLLGRASIRTNLLAAGDYLPRVIGRTRVHPPQVTHPIRYLEGRDEVVEALYALAGRTLVEDLRIAGVPAADVQGVEAQVVDWRSPLDTQTLLQRYGATRTVGRPLKWYEMNKDVGDDILDQAQSERSLPAWDSVVLPAHDEARIRLGWPQGLMETASADATVYQPMRLRVRAVGAEDWVHLPEIWWSNRDGGEYRKDIVLRRGPAGPAPAVLDPSRTTIRAYARAPGQARYGLIGSGAANGGSISGWAGWIGMTGGTGTAIVAIATPTLSAPPADGTAWRLRPLEGNGGAATTIAIDGLPPIGVTGTMVAETDYELIYSTGTGTFAAWAASGSAPFLGLDIRPSTPDWVAHQHFREATITPSDPHVPLEADRNLQLCEEGVILWIDDTVVADGPIEVGIIAGAATRASDWSFSAYAQTFWAGGPVVRDFYGYGQHGTSGRYAPHHAGLFVGPPAIQELVVMRHAPPTVGLTRSDATVIAIRGRNVAIGEVSMVATSVIADRATDSWLATDNPARLSEALARGEATNRGLSATIDTAAYDGWAAHCADAGFRVGFESAGLRWDEVQKLLASAGRGGFAMAGNWRPYWDRDRSAEDAVMAFTPANSRFLGLSRAWPAVRTDALRVTWRDEAADWQDRSTIVYAPGVDASSMRALEDVRYPELPTEALALARAAYDLALPRARATRLAIETDHAAEAVRKGDLVVAVYDVLAEADETHGVNERALSQSTYVRTVTRNEAGQVVGLVLEKPLYVEPTADSLWDAPDLWEAPGVLAIGDPYVALVTVGRTDPAALSQPAGVVVSLDVLADTAGPTTELAIAPASLPHANRISSGQIVSVGRRRRLSRRCLVEAIEPAGSHFKLTLVPEAPELFA